MTTIHAFTNDQNLLDVFHKDLHRARAATASMIPTSTGAARAVGLVLPALKGKLDGVAFRVPTQNVSIVDLTFVPRRATSVEEINAAIRAAADGPMAGVLGYHEAPLVSVDFNHDSHSSTVDLRRHQGDRRQARARRVLVRQRVGLLLPHERRRRPARQALSAPWPGSAPSTTSIRPARRCWCGST